MSKIRVLVVSHNAFSESKNNGKTINALFSNWSNEYLAQFYIFNEIPDNNICKKYFRVTDYDILNANLKLNTSKGRKFNGQISEASIEDNHLSHVADEVINSDDVRGIKRLIYKSIENRLPIMELAREVAWRKSKWQSEEFKKWLDDFNPQAIFALNSNCPFFHKIMLWVQKRFNVPLYLYSTDDYTFVRSSFSPIAWVNYFRYMSWFKKSISISKKLYVISLPMKDEYSKRFGIENISILTNCVNEIAETDEPITDDSVLRLIYAGGLHCNRWKVLHNLGMCLEQLKKEGFNAVLDVYCPTKPSQKIIDYLIKTPSVQYKGTLNQAQLLDEINKCNILVHVESFDKKSIKTTRLSFSTKIPEYMVSNRCILAIGPEQVASMRYLKENGAALCISSTDRNEITQMIKEYLFNSDYRVATAKRAKKVALENHDINKIQEKLYGDLKNSVIE